MGGKPKTSTEEGTWFSMEDSTSTRFRIGDWQVDSVAGQISRNGETARVEVRTMRLLVCLAEHAGQVVSIDDLLNHAWTGVAVSPDSVYQAVASLRRLLGDDPKQPTYIETVPRLGYRMLAAVSPWPDPSNGTQSIPPPGSLPTLDQNTPTHPMTAEPVPHSRRNGWLALTAIAALLLAIAIPLLFHAKAANNTPAPSPTALPTPQNSIAVLPFLDLTQGMKEEEFADGMTEELIDKLSKIPGLRVPSPTSSFYFKGKQIPVADIAKSLGVAYVVDGSVRKSGEMLRVAARLVRADNGYVVWSETYDRPFTDRLMVQDDIAGEVAKALNATSELNGR
jgi:TolB-like protein/DNA-binding winged helix-turn-helix (wHTH) protein